MNGGGVPFRVSSTASGGRTTVTVAGELDYATRPRLRAALQDAFARGSYRVDVDLSGVTFCDCSGMNVLLEASARAKASGTAFGLVGPLAPIVERLFRLTGTSGVLPVRVPV